MHMSLGPTDSGRHTGETGRRSGFIPWLGAILAGALVLLVFLLPPTWSRTATVSGERDSKKLPDPDGTRPGRAAKTVEPRFRLATDAEAWACLPATTSGSQAPLPAWARALAKSLPRTTAAMLELDHLHRSRSPLDPELRGQVRWVAAHASGCEYAKAYALADLRSAGFGKSADQLTEGLAAAPPDRRALLEFVYKLAAAPQSLTDDEVTRLISKHGEKQMVAVVLLVAYAQFQDRLVLALGIAAEPGEPLPSLGVRFTRQPFGIASVPPSRPNPPQPPTGSAPPARPALDANAVQCGLDKQRTRRPRIRLPDNDPGANRWGLVGQIYQPELANAWSTCTQAFGEEANQDPVFEQSLFWLITGSKGCFY